MLTFVTVEGIQPAIIPPREFAFQQQRYLRTRTTTVFSRCIPALYSVQQLRGSFAVSKFFVEAYSLHSKRRSLPDVHLRDRFLATRSKCESDTWQSEHRPTLGHFW